MVNKKREMTMAVALVAIGWFANELVDFGAGERQKVEPTVPTVAVERVRRQAFNPVTEYVGHVEPTKVTDILPQIDGYIKNVCFDEGAKVEVGDLLFEIDDEQYLAARNLRHSEVASAEAKVIVAQADVDRAERYFRRLSAADDRGITGTELDTAETALASARAELNSANAAVEQAKASAAIAEFNLKHTKVYSPISGRIGKALHHVGDYVSPSKSALARVVQLDPIRVIFPITDRDYDEWQAAAEREGSSLQCSRSLRLKLANGDIYSACGKIEFGDNEMNRGTGTLVMYASYENAAGRLVPNAYVRVLSDAAKPPEALTVPVRAVELSEDGSRRVWVMGEDGIVHPVTVEIGDSWEGMAEVCKGLKGDETVVSLGTFKLKDGDRVRVVQP